MGSNYTLWPPMQLAEKEEQNWSIAMTKLALTEKSSTEQGQNSNLSYTMNSQKSEKMEDYISLNTCNIWNSGQNGNIGGYCEKRYNNKTLPASEMLPRSERLGGYIFVCNNDTMQEDLRRHLFGLPQRYKDSVREITPGLPLFLYNYTSHQLHGVFQADSFGGSNIDPTAWEDKKCKGESRFPAQVRIRVKRRCRPLTEDAFRPVLHHYDGPKFRLQLSIKEALALLDLFTEDAITLYDQ
ncbi:hypothetical protein AMTRI_Chr11g158650 [Amborella trichopoda]|uniref:DCD domain-containing protein n=1 Tax=Amborella trichopoda TaxID=13333 RepID=W1NWR0_AMBTC|nr:B2 protein [Amborella trichopoda]ERM99758.1 hypothetical protein AMTR_s00099p00128180 [Amborella trichopoda]|eukprot:XP_006836905.1 B2 protein [Amborella trichopoda]